MQRYFRLLRDLGVESPVFLLLSLVGVGDYQMLQRGIPQHYNSQLRPVDRDALLVPEVLVPSLEQDLHALQRHMRPFSTPCGTLLEYKVRRTMTRAVTGSDGVSCPGTQPLP